MNLDEKLKLVPKEIKIKIRDLICNDEWKYVIENYVISKGGEQLAELIMEAMVDLYLFSKEEK